VHGYARGTLDIDVFIRATPENLRLTRRALTAFGYDVGDITDSPDGSRVVFSSNRSGNMDLWVLETRTGALHQLTDDPARDWDPGFTPDGRHVLWSSDRSGHLEIWMASTDGSGARQVTHDGVDAENPNATPDGRFIVYTSGKAQRLTESLGVSPDGKRLVVSTLQEYSSLTLAEGLAGLEPPRL